MTAVISDVHGNYPALKAVLRELDAINCKQILSLGDVAGYYCMINECIDEFRARNIINLMGNHDAYILGYRQCSRSLTVNRCIAYQKNVITEKNFTYLSNSPLSYEDAYLSARHGGWKDPIDEYVEAFDFSLVREINKKLYCSGHTHIQKRQDFEGKVYFNPGAVGQPRDGDARAAYALIRDGVVTLHRAAYPIEQIVQAMAAEGFERRISECLFYGEKIRPFGSA